MKKHTEARFEDAIVAELCHTVTDGVGGFEFVDYNAGPEKDRFDRSRAIDPSW